MIDDVFVFLPLNFLNPSLSSSSLFHSSGPYGGGAIYDTSSSLLVENCTFSGNTAADGGALTVFLFFIFSCFSLSPSLLAAAAHFLLALPLSPLSTASLQLVKSPDAAAFPMYVSISRSRFTDNRATGIYGGAVFVASTDSLSVSSALFRGNVATKGGAARIRNDLKEAGTALGDVSFSSCAFEDNVAQFGGGIHVDGGGSVALSLTNFTANAASAAGAGVAVGDGGSLEASGARFSRNGNSSCVSPPGTGGALAVGIDDFKPYAGCSAPATVPPSANVSASLFEGNVAAAAGGAVAVRSGTFTLSDSRILNNAVTGSATIKLPLGASSIAMRELAIAEAVVAGSVTPSTFAAFFGNVSLPDSSLSSPPAGNPRARGGGVFVGGSCGASGTCTSARAALENVTLSGNSAAEGGGGLFYEGTGSAGSALSVSGGSVRGNRAPEGSTGGGGVGGGVALVGRGFSLEGVAVSANAARFGGGLFVSADLSPPAAAEGGTEGSRNVSLSSISFGTAAAAAADAAAETSVLDGNAGARGRDVFWLRAASPAAALACDGCSFFDADAAPATSTGPAASSSASSSTSSSSPLKNSASFSSLALTSPPPGGALATEAISAALENFSSSSPSSTPSRFVASVQSGSPAPAFAVSLLDFYGQVSNSDGGGSCEVAAAAWEGATGEGAAAAKVLLPDAGRRAAVSAGRALFDRLVVTGGIGSEVPLTVGCVPSPAAGKLGLLSRVPKAAAEDGPWAEASSLVDVPVALPALPLKVSVSECGRGTQAPPPESKISYPVCSPCPFGTYSFSGNTCAPCRDGKESFGFTLFFGERIKKKK